MEDESQNQDEGQRVPPPPPSPPTAIASPEPEGSAPHPRTSGLAIGSLVLALTIVGAPISLLLGITALMQSRRNPHFRGAGMALAGIGISAFGIAVILLAAFVVIPLLKTPYMEGQRPCLQNLRLLSSAMQTYMADYDDTFPPPERWNDALRTYVENSSAWICPVAKSQMPTYAMNERLGGGLRSRDVKAPAGAVMLFESAPGRNQAGERGLFPLPPRHGDRYSVSFVDGHVRSIPYRKTGSLNWDPHIVAAPPSEECGFG